MQIIYQFVAQTEVDADGPFCPGGDCDTCGCDHCDRDSSGDRGRGDTHDDYDDYDDE